MILCACGNKFKGLRGIKKHQTSCRVIRGLDKELLSELQNISDFKNQPDLDHHVVRSEENPMFKTWGKVAKKRRAVELSKQLLQSRTSSTRNRK